MVTSPAMCMYTSVLSPSLRFRLVVGACGSYENLNDKFEVL